MDSQHTHPYHSWHIPLVVGYRWRHACCTLPRCIPMTLHFDPTFFWVFFAGVLLGRLVHWCCTMLCRFGRLPEMAKFVYVDDDVIVTASASIKSRVDFLAAGHDEKLQKVEGSSTFSWIRGFCTWRDSFHPFYLILGRVASLWQMD